MPLIADRFILEDRPHAIDLATGRAVRLNMEAAGAEEEQQQWALRCDRLQKLHHPALARLVDYGAVGESQRFEAWQCEELWQGPVSDAERVRATACALLRACGMSDGLASMTSVHTCASQPVFVPDAQAGFDRDHADSEDLLLPIELHGVRALERRPVQALCELFEAGLRPRVACLWGPDGAGKDVAATDLARAARLRGYVPVAVRLFARYSDQVRGRSLFLIDTDASRSGWATLIRACLLSPRAHALVFLGCEEAAGAEGIRLDTFPDEALVEALCPPVNAAGLGPLRRLAARAAGWPGLFARLVWRSHAPTPIAHGVRAAEQAAVYGANEANTTTSVWSEEGDLVPLRERLRVAMRLVDRGRHAPGERALRSTIGRLSRRGDWVHASDGSLALAKMLLRRGRATDAHVVLQQAADFCRGMDDSLRLVDLAIQNAVALVDLARLDDAEAVLSAAMSTARAARDPERAAAGATELARVLFWRGRYDEAEDALNAGAVNLATVTAGGLGARIAVGRRAHDVAVARAVEALQRTRGGDQRALAEAAYGAAFAHLAVGDVAAAERDIATSIRAARAAREPLWAARSRLWLIETYRRSGRHGAARALLDRIGSAGTKAFPPIVRARWDLLKELLSESASQEALVARHVAATGLEALALFACQTEMVRRPSGVDSFVDDLVGILQLCQTSTDETAILLEVCRRVRQRIHAAAVALATFEGNECSLVAADGRLDAAIAVRARTVGATIAPHLQDDRLESAAPVHYGGTVIGALLARWTVGTPHDLSPAASLLTAAAAAAAPVLAAVSARSRQPSVDRLLELQGTSVAMVEVRRAVDRAAAAPFPILVEGESGSGKELVARALHRSGPRRDRSFCTINCAALPDELLEAELFGHARGAFTGAVNLRPGVFEEAHGGTLFLDEIGELSPRAQAKLLRVLQDGELRRLGENVARRIDVRVISATNRDLRHEVAEGRFRRDLLYRLDVIRIVVPPLRERREDVALLAEQFWQATAVRLGSRATLAASTLAALAGYDWPGNVRELQNVLASLLVRCARRGVVPHTALGPQFGQPQPVDATRLDDARKTFEERFVRAALVRTGGHRGRAAHELGVTRQGLTKLMTRLGISE